MRKIYIIHYWNHLNYMKMCVMLRFALKCLDKKMRIAKWIIKSLNDEKFYMPWSLYVQSRLFRCLSFHTIKTLKKPLKSFHQAAFLLPLENFMVCSLTWVECWKELSICPVCSLDIIHVLLKIRLAFLGNRDRNKEMSSVSESWKISLFIKNHWDK